MVREVRFDANVDLVFALSAAPAAQTGALPSTLGACHANAGAEEARRAQGHDQAGVSRGREAAAPKPAARPVAAPDCDPPHYFDEQGIKRYRRECLGR